MRVWTAECRSTVPHRFKYQSLLIASDTCSRSYIYHFINCAGNDKMINLILRSTVALGREFEPHLQKYRIIPQILQ